MADLQHLGQRQVGLFKVAVIIYGGGWGGDSLLVTNLLMTSLYNAKFFS